MKGVPGRFVLCQTLAMCKHPHVSTISGRALNIPSSMSDWHPRHSIFVLAFVRGEVSAQQLVQTLALPFPSAPWET